MKSLMLIFALGLAFLIVAATGSSVSAERENLVVGETVATSMMPMGLTYDGQHLWATLYSDPTLSRKVYISKLDLSGDVLSSFEAPGPNGWDLAWDGEYLWYVESGYNRIYKFDIDGNVISEIVTTGDISAGLTWDGEHLWISNLYVNSRIYELDTSGNEFSWIDLGIKFVGLAWDGEYLWGLVSGENKIYELDTSGNVISIFEAPILGRGLTWGGGFLWLTSPEDNKIYGLRVTIYYSLSALISPSGGGSVTLNPPGENYENGTEVTVTAEPTEGYVFQDWTGDVPASHENDNSITLLMDSDKTLTAHFLWAGPVYNLTVSIDPFGGGSVSLNHSGGSYEEGTVVTVAAVPAEGYVFGGWSGDVPSGMENDTSITVLMDSDKSLTVHFSKVGISTDEKLWILVGVAVVIAVIAGVFMLKRH